MRGLRVALYDEMCVYGMYNLYLMVNMHVIYWGAEISSQNKFLSFDSESKFHGVAAIRTTEQLIK